MDKSQEQRIKDFYITELNDVQLLRLSANAQAAAERLRAVCDEISSVPMLSHTNKPFFVSLSINLNHLLVEYGTVDDRRNSFDEPKAVKATA